MDLISLLWLLASPRTWLIALAVCVVLEVLLHAAFGTDVWRTLIGRPPVGPRSKSGPSRHP